MVVLALTANIFAAATNRTNIDKTGCMLSLFNEMSMNKTEYPTNVRN